MSKPTTWKACQEELVDSRKRIAALTAKIDALRADLRAVVEAARNAKTCIENVQSLSLTRFGAADMIDRALARPGIVALDSNA